MGVKRVRRAYLPNSKSGTGSAVPTPPPYCARQHDWLPNPRNPLRRVIERAFRDGYKRLVTLLLMLAHPFNSAHRTALDTVTALVAQGRWAAGHYLIGG